MANAINSLSYNNNTYVFTTPYGSCSTAAGTAAKTVSVDNFSLETGARVSVKFTYANTAGSPTLNVNSTGAKAIYWHGAALPSSQYWEAGAALDFIYNGTQWELIGIAKDNNTTYTALKNPNALTIQGNGTTLTNGTYDGSAAKTVNITPTSIGLGNVENKSSATIRGELTKSNVTTALGYTPLASDGTANKADLIAYVINGSNYDYPLLFGGSASGVYTAPMYDSGITVNPSTNTITATTFKGALSGNATTATTATKLGSSTVGGAAKPIYLNAGTATACSSTVGGADTPVYMNAGTITSCGKSFSSYLPLSGGTMTGSFTMPNATAIMANNASGTARPMMYISTANHLTLGNPAEGNPIDGGIRLYAPKELVYLITKDGVRMDCSGGSVRWYPYSGTNYSAIFNTIEDSIASLGSTSYRWYRLFQSASTVSTSDEREKSDIMSIVDYPTTYSRDGSGNIFERLFNKLQPKTYTLNIENSSDLHIGFIAQDIVASMEELGLSEDDLGFIIHDYWTDEETGEEKDRYGLAYEEFMALNTYMIQKQQATINEQQSQITDLENRIAQLEKLVNAN